MSNPIFTTTNSKLDTRVKEPSGVVPPPSGVRSLDRFNCTTLAQSRQNNQTCTALQYYFVIIVSILTLNYNFFFILNLILLIN